MNLAIFEPTATGHNMILYVRHIVREAFQRGWDVTLATTRETMDHPATRIVFEENRNKVDFFCIQGTPAALPSSPWNILRLQWAKYRNFALGYRDLARKNEPDTIIVPCLDHIYQILRLIGSPFRSTPFSGILVNSRCYLPCVGIGSLYSPSHWMNIRLFLRFLSISTLRGCATTNEPFYKYTRKIFPKSTAKLLFVPECASLSGFASRQEARDAFYLKHDHRVILVYGSLRVSKGLASLLKAMCHPNCTSRAVLLLAGRIGPDVRALLERPDARALRQFGRLLEFELQGSFEDDTEWRLFKAADMVWVGYTGHYGMSGVLAQAGSVGLPVIACREGLIGWMCSTYNLGVCVDVNDVSKVVKIINRFSKNNELRTAYKMGAADFSKRHSPNNFSRLICNTIAPK